MDNSFFEYRDKTGVESESDSEVIDNSLLLDESLSPKKKLGSAVKNRTVFVAESEESSAVDESDEDSRDVPKIVVRQSSGLATQDISSSSDESPEASPEILPKRRPPAPRPADSPNTSTIGRAKHKRMILLDSDTDNSFVIEHNKNKKMVCLKHTPSKVEDNKMAAMRKVDSSISSVMDQSVSYTDDSDDDDLSNDIENNYAEQPKISSRIKNRIALNESDESSAGEDNKQQSDTEKQESDDEIEGSDREIHQNDDRKQDSDDEIEGSDRETHRNDDKKQDSDDEKRSSNKILEVSKDKPLSEEVDNYSDDDETGDDGPDEDQMVYSRATRMSIMGVLPKGDADSDDSDFIQSDEKSHTSSTNSLPELPDVTIANWSEVTPRKPSLDTDSSRISCSPFASPLHDITNEANQTKHSPKKNSSTKTREVIDKENEVVTFSFRDKNKGTVDDDDVTFVSTNQEADRSGLVKRERMLDDDVAIVESNPEIIALSSDDEEDPKPEKSPSAKRSLGAGPRGGAGTMKQYLVPPSYPNQQVVYVKKHVRDNELAKLEGLKEDLHNIKYLLENMELDSLPDGGTRLLKRLEELEGKVRQQGEKVANMVLEPDAPTAEDVARDGFDAQTGLSWEELQKGSQAVQPRMFGKQADDMGLGKTITMISLVVSDKDNKIDEDDDDEEGGKGISKLARGGTLVVCPASLVQQWSGEVTKHCSPHAATVCLHHGPARATHPHRLATHDIVLTTYNILQRDSEKNGVLMKVVWRRIILDEAHIVRNHKSATSTAVSALRGRRRWCLTGTPVQNKDLDLFALLKFLRCTPFDELTMWKKWIDNKSQGGQDRLSTIMQCILLRRTKVQLQEKGQLNCLPERTAHVQEVTLTKEEMNVYQKVLVFSKTLFAQFLHQRAEKQADQGLAADNAAYDKMHKRMIALQGAKPVKSHEILVLLLRLRQVCCHCGLIAAMLDEETAGDQVDMDPGGQDLLAELNKLSIEDSRSKRKSQASPKKEEEPGPEPEGTTAAEAIRSVLSPSNPVFELDRQSSKIHAVMQCLQERVFANQGHKAVVVSQWTSVLRLVEKELGRMRVRSVTLSGAVPVPQRPPLIDKLNDPRSDVKVMLLSLCAGGVGLNLCGANHLLLLDPHWNPQLEEQAQDRIYRVGQTRPVHIYRFMCVETVEQSIRKLQLAKLELAENVLTGAKNTNNSKLTIEDLKMLFNMGEQ